jgi:acyl-CoA thioesterase-1
MNKRILLWVVAVCLLWGCTQSGSKDEQGALADSVSLSEPAGTADRKVIVFFGNSLTAGYGLKLSEAYPAVVQERLNAANLPYTVVNAGVSGETTASGNARVDWILESQVDIFVLELGGNDGLRGIPVSETSKNLQSIIDKVKTKSPTTKILLAGMQVPPNMGKKYADEFAAIYPTLAKKNDIHLIPFLLEHVGGERHLNLEDGIHPTAEGQRLVAENVWVELKKLL